MRQITGDILDQKYGIIGHQVNCQLIMGAGVAKQIREKYPRAFTEYQAVMANVGMKRRLGKCQIVEVRRGKLYIAHLFGQYHYVPRTVQHTDYNALTIAMRQMVAWRNKVMGKDFPIFLPVGMGCGLGGGQWAVVSGLIRSVIPDATLVKLPMVINK